MGYFSRLAVELLENEQTDRELVFLYEEDNKIINDDPFPEKKKLNIQFGIKSM